MLLPFYQKLTSHSCPDCLFYKIVADILWTNIYITMFADFYVILLYLAEKKVLDK